jgi:flagellar hook-associated protein 2
LSTTGVSSVLTNINNAFSGKTSGIDVAATVDALMQLQRAPETLLQNQQSAVNTRISILGTIASDLSQVQTAVNDLTDPLGALSQKTVTSSDSSLVTASAQASAVAGTHTVVVRQLATVSSSYSDPVKDPTTLAGTTLTIAYGDPNNPTKTDSIAIPDTIKTLQDVADAINGSANNTGVTASVITDANGQRLALVSKTSGKDGNLTVTGAVNFTQGVEGKSANLTVDGVPIESTTNTVTGALQGVDLVLSGSDPNTTVHIGVTPDTTTAASAVNNFITAYNNAMKDINAQFTTDSSGNGGPLVGDSALRTLQSQLLEIAGYAPGGNGEFVNLQQMGIEMQNDGTLQMNSSVLQDALTNHYSDVQNFFQSADSSSFGRTVTKMLTQITDPIQGTVSSDVSGQQAISNDLTQQINDFEARMTLVQQQLTQQYSQLNILLQQYPMEIQQVSQQLGALNPSNNK